MAASQFKVTDKFFKDLGLKAKQIADEEAQQMAIDMQFILRLRRPLKGGNGKWPRYDAKTPSMGTHSFTGWKIQKRVNGEYWLANHHESITGFSYANILAKGKGWSTNVLLGDWKRLTGTAVKGVFSTQMPNGLAPWIEIKRGDMENKIMNRLKKEL